MSSQHELITTLDSLGCITLSGPQATEYLQGQVTIDAAKMNSTAARFGAHCDVKGKTWSAFTAFREDDVYHLLMHKSCLEKSLAEFKKYGVFSKVDIQSTGEELAFYGVSGSVTLATINALFADLTEQHLSVTSNQFGCAICLNITAPRYVLVLNTEGQALLSELTALFTYAEQKQWDALNIVDAIPCITAETSNEFVPQMLNLQALAGIDFDKGCYMGQETIARTKFLGRNKRAAYQLTREGINTSLHIQPSMALEKMAGENWRSGGTVLQSAELEGNTLLLAVLANDTQTGDVLRLKDAPELQFEVGALPYKLD